LLDHWDEVKNEPWLEQLLHHEEISRGKRSLERRIKTSALGSFKLIADFEWSWPRKIDRPLIESLFDFQWIADAANVILVGPNGCGKTMIAKNLAYQAVLAGYSARFWLASDLLNSLAEIDSSAGLSRRIKAICRPRVLVVDELGYLSYGTHHADLLYEIVSRRYEDKPIIITTNSAFADWGAVFPAATCVTTIVDRLVHHSVVTDIDADSWRLKEARENEAKRSRGSSATRVAVPMPSQTSSEPISISLTRLPKPALAISTSPPRLSMTVSTWTSSSVPSRSALSGAGRGTTLPDHSLPSAHLHTSEPFSTEPGSISRCA
jgi:DNA replication protein DnaC